MPPISTLIVGLSGPSSSGKSTLARLLRTIFNITLPDRRLNLFILHEDDFYKANEQIPVKTFTSNEHGTRELQDWDCGEAMDFPLFERVMKYIKTNGKLPDDMYSKEDQNELGKSHVVDAVIEGAKSEAVKWFASLDLPDSSNHFQTVERRGNRAGYVTLGEFWVDPPGYVEDVVWPNYVREHAWMFEGGDVDGGELSSRVEDEGISVALGKGEAKMEELLGWGIKVVKQSLTEQMA